MPLAAGELEVADLHDHRSGLDDEDEADQRQDQDLAGDQAVTASVAPSASEPESPMKIWAGWTLNHRNPSSAPMISAHRRARFGWAGEVERAISM